MNNIRAIEALNQRELEAGVPLSASWHTDWSDTAYVFIGGLPYELSEGDIITIFSQFGEPVHVNLVRDKDTGKSKGFAFLKYEDQRSTNLAVDNLGGATILGRIIRVDHTRYKPKEGEVVDENAHANAGTRAKNDEDQARHTKRRRGDGDSDESGQRKAPSREMLKEELELQKLIREHDEDDPMKEYLIREKKEEVQKALAKLRADKKSSKHRHHSGRDSKNEHRHRSRRHRSQSREPSRRRRSRSVDRRHSAKAFEENHHPRDYAREEHRDRPNDNDRAKDRYLQRERGGDRERRDSRDRDGHKERERGQERDMNKEKGRIQHKDRERTEVTRKERHGDDK